MSQQIPIRDAVSASSRASFQQRQRRAEAQISTKKRTQKKVSSTRQEQTQKEKVVQKAENKLAEEQKELERLNKLIKEQEARIATEKKDFESFKSIRGKLFARLDKLTEARGKQRRVLNERRADLRRAKRTGRRIDPNDPKVSTEESRRRKMFEQSKDKVTIKATPQEQQTQQRGSVLLQSQEGYKNPITGEFVPQSRQVAVASTTNAVFAQSQAVKAQKQADQQRIKRNLTGGQNGRVSNRSNNRLFANNSGTLESNRVNRGSFQSREQKGIAGVQQDITDFGKAQERKAQRTGGSFTQLSSGLSTVFAFGAGVASAPVSTVSAALNPVQTAKGLFTAVSRPRQTATMLASEFKANPAFGSGVILGEVLTGKGVSKVVGTGVKIGSKVTDPINPRFKGNVDIGQNIDLGEGSNIIVKGGTQSAATPLPQQARQAGTRVDAVSGAQSFFDPFGIKRNVIINKPQAEGLEAAFFADPNAALRTSRLGGATPRQASTLDILTGDFTISRPRSQALFFRDEPVADLPTDIKSSLARGKTLTPSQEKRLLDQQLQNKDQFQPIGFIGKESEITLSPGSTVQRVKSRGFVRFQGEKVEIIEARTIKGKNQDLSSELNNKINNDFTKQLQTPTNRATGTTATTRSTSPKQKPVLRAPGVFGSRRPSNRARGSSGVFGRPGTSPFAASRVSAINSPARTGASPKSFTGGSPFVPSGGSSGFSGTSSVTRATSGYLRTTLTGTSVFVPSPKSRFNPFSKLKANNRGGFFGQSRRKDEELGFTGSLAAIGTPLRGQRGIAAFTGITLRK